MAVKKRKSKKRLHTSAKLRTSKLKVFDIPVDNIVSSEENPQEMDDTTFDQLVEGIQNEGFDEPCLVMPVYDDDGEAQTGQYVMVSGHHRMKACKVAGIREIPCIIKEGWDETARQIALVRRNHLRGQLNPEKFTKLYDELVRKGLDREVLKIQLGFTKKDGFAKVYKSIADSLPPAKKRQMEQMKEEVKSVDDLSGIINKLFKEEGSKLNSNFMVFSLGGKSHHYFKVDKQVHTLLKDMEADIENHGLDANDVFQELLSSRVVGVQKAKPKRKKLK